MSGVRDVEPLVGAQIRSGGGPGPNKWTYPPEMWLYAFGPDVGSPANDGCYFVRRVNLNLAQGCSHGCLYCYIRPIVTRYHKGILDDLPPETASRTPLIHPQQYTATMEYIKRSSRWRHPKVMIAASATDALLPALRGAYSDVFNACAEYGVPLTVLTKRELEDPLEMLPKEAHPNFSLLYGITLTCNDEDAAEIEPYADPPSARLASLRRVGTQLRLRRLALYPVTLWASLTPLHTRSGDLKQLASRAANAGADFLAAEVLHDRGKWCVDHLIPKEQHEKVVKTLLGSAERLNVPVFLKDELRELALSHPKLRKRYIEMVEKAFAPVWPVHKLQLRGLTLFGSEKVRKEARKKAKKQPKPPPRPGAAPRLTQSRLFE